MKGKQREGGREGDGKEEGTREKEKEGEGGREEGERRKGRKKKGKMKYGKQIHSQRICKDFFQTYFISCGTILEFDWNWILQTLLIETTEQRKKEKENSFPKLKLF